MAGKYLWHSGNVLGGPYAFNGWLGIDHELEIVFEMNYGLFE